jgi:putative hydrolase of the HAD superfamily
VSDFDAVLFDAGGVLVVPAPVLTGRLLAPFGAVQDEASLVRAHFAAAHAMDQARADGDLAEWPAYHLTYARSAGVAPAHEAAATAAMSAEFDHWMWCHPVPGARDALAALHDRGVPIGIVSNAAGQVEGELARLGICRRVERVVEPDGAEVPAVVLDPARTAEPEPVPVACVVDSHVVGVSKPDPRIFEPALAALGLPASARVAYVGDTVFYDVRAAAAAGLTPLLHDPFGFHAADPHPSGPHRTLPTLGDLAALVSA